jgi:autotransporter-associated beta strand protein
MRLEDRTLPSVFGSPVTSSTGSPISHFLVAGDFNGDGQLDVVTLNSDSSTTSSLSVLRGDGHGSFQPATGSPVSVGSSDALVDAVVGHFRGPSAPLDVAVLDITAGAVQIWQGDGTGKLSLGSTVNVGSVPQSITAADVFNQGHTDLIIANFGDHTVQVLKGDGSGAFQAQTAIPVDGAPVSIVAADINGDRNFDLVVANSARQIDVMTGDGNGNFTKTGASPITGQVLDGRRGLLVANVAGDSSPDIVEIGLNGSGTSDTQGIQVFTGDGAGGFAPGTEQTYDSSAYHFTVAAAADFDGDGHLDLTAGTFNPNFLGASDGLPFYLVGDGNGAFANQGAINPGTGDFASAVAVGDFNGDGLPDVAQVSGNRNGGSVFVNLNTSAPTREDTSTTLSSSTDPSLIGQPVTFTATVTPTIGSEDTPTGTVTFLDNGTPFGSANLDSNRQAIVTDGGDTALSQGLHLVTAIYGGDVLFGPSRSLDLGQEVRDPTTTQLNLSSNSLVNGQPIIFTATIAPTISSAVAPGGNMQFNVIRGGITIGGLSVPIVNSGAQISSSQLPVGLADHDQISAWYLGDLNFAPSQTPAQTLIVRQAKTFTWSGLGADNLWSDGDNWVGGIAPSPGDSLIFPAGAAQPRSVNDFAAGSQFGSLTFNFASVVGSAATDFYISGAPIHIGPGGFTVNAPAPTLGQSIGISTGSIPPPAVRFSPDVQLDTTLPTSVAVESDSELDVDGRVLAGDPNTIIPGASSGGIIKSGFGTLDLNSSNSYSGPTVVEEGTVAAEAPGALGTGAVTVRQSATLGLFGGNNFANPLVLGGTLVDHGGGDSWSGPIALLWPSAVVDVESSGIIFDLPLTLGGTITGRAGLRKQGAGTLVLAGHNAYIGATSIQDGTLRLQDAAALGSSTGSAAFVAPGATLEVAGGITVNHALILLSPEAQLRSASGNNTWSGTITLCGKDAIEVTSDQLKILGKVQPAASLPIGGTVALVGQAGILKTGTGELILAHADTLNKSTEVAEGVLDLRDINALGSSPVQVDIGATIAIDAVKSSIFFNALTLAGAGFQNQGALHLIRGTSTWAGPLSFANAGGITLSGVAAVAADASARLYVAGFHGGTLEKLGAGDLTIGRSDYTGATFVIEGSLTVQHAQGLGLVSEGVTVDRNATLNVSAPVGTTWPIFLSLTLLPGSSVTLAGVNWGGAITLAGTATVFVPNHRTARLSGFISGTDGATLIKTGPGSLTMNGPPIATFATVLDASGANLIELQSGTLAFSQGQTGLLESLSLSLAGGFVPAFGQAFDIVRNETNQSVGGTFMGLAEGSVFQIDGLWFRITYRGGDGGRDVVVTRIAVQQR